ncbi:MAG: type I restriction enzyme HsdR N-terminal domain-containing protein [Bacteroidaceae bacterium]|nr:type I restriction enzyme HsdR N-terminal domain-containing protein [Bacteroidaceae bacterium]
MQELNLPQYDAKIVEKEGKPAIFDHLRRCYVALTPEEWVRQHFVHYLIEQCGYPASLMANEASITLNNTRRRCDTVVYDRTLRPRMIIEYKAPTVRIDAKVFAQISRYNLVLRVDYLIVSNGIKHYCCRMNYTDNSYEFLTGIPQYDSIQ